MNDFNNKKDFKSKLLRIGIAFILAELLNLACKVLFCNVAHIPLFIDTIGTVAVTFYAGLLPGILTAATFNILWVIIIAAISNNPIYPWDMIYAVCGIVIVVITWLFSRKKSNFNISRLITVLYLVLIALVSAFASSVVGGIIESANRIHFGSLAYSSVLEQFVRAFLGENIGIFASCIIARVPVTVLDRMICTFAGFFVYRLCCSKGQSYVQ